MSTETVIAIVGATGLVGNEIVTILEQRKFPCKEVRLLASQESVGEVYRIGALEASVELLANDSFEGVTIAFFTSTPEISAQYVPIARAAGAIVIDCSGYYGSDKNASAPLIVPEVNGEKIVTKAGILSVPSAIVTQLVAVLSVAHKAAVVKRVVVSTYQSVSSAGKTALDELWGQTLGIFNQREMEHEAFEHQIAFNCIPQIDLVLDDGYTKEERRIIDQSRTILELPNLAITATAVRVPVLHSHAMTINLETKNPLSASQFSELLSVRPEFMLHADHADFPMQINVTGGDEIHVGRIRADTSVEHGLNLWVVADNLRKGSALNAVQIAESLCAQSVVAPHA